MPSYQSGVRGRASWKRFDFEEAALEEMRPHICMKSSAYEVVKSILEGGTSSFMSNVEKLSNGIKAGGLSPTKDLSTGGANRVFIGLFDKDKVAASNYYAGRHQFVRFNRSVIMDTDAIALDYDLFGRVSAMQSENYAGGSVKALKRANNRGSNEFLVKNKLPLTELEYVPVESERQREILLDMLKKSKLKPKKGKWSDIVKVDEEIW